MTNQRDLLKRLFNAFKPFEPLKPDSPVYVDCREQSLIDEDNQTLEKKINLLIEQGILNISIEKYLEAISAYDKALEIKPDNG